MKRRNELSPVERRALLRRERARAHLARVRNVPSPLPRRSRVPLLAVAAFLGLGVLLSGPTLDHLGSDVRSIHVRGAERLPVAEIAAATGVTPGAAAFEVDADAIARSLAAHPRIEGARAVWLPGGRVVVEVVERTPVAVALLGDPVTPFVVDRSGTAFAPAEPEDVNRLPRLVGAEGAVPGVSSNALAAAAALAARLPALGLAVPTEVGVAPEGDPEGFHLRLSGLPVRVVLGTEDLDARLETLVRLLASGVPELGTAEQLDLRFADQAVLRGEPTS